MNYQDFLSTIIQLSSQRRAKIILDQRPICIESLSSPNTWTLSTKIYSPGRALPHFVQECLSSRGLFRWQEKGPYLKLNTIDQCVYLMQEIEEQKSYISFKCLLNNFSYLSKEWQEIIESFSDNLEEVCL